MSDSQRWTLSAASVIAVIAGVLAFAIGIVDGAPVRAWAAFLSNLLFWLGIAQGGVVISAALYLTQARWGGSALYRLAEAFAGFLPLGFLLFWGLFAGRALIFPWVLHPIARKAAWLNVPFLFIRDGSGLLLMTALSFYFIRASRRTESVKWAQSYATIEMPPPTIRRLAPVVIVVYAVVYSILAFDLVMSLSPLWSSTLFGAYFFEGAFWSAIVAVALLAILLTRGLEARDRPARRQLLHDLGKLVFAFSVFWVYLMFSQYLPIWYADLPRETFFVVERVHSMPWGPLGWTVAALVWAVPFVTLMGRRPKMTPGILGAVCVLGLVGMWIERYLLIAPSLSARVIPFGWIEILITLGFVGAFTLTAQPGLRLVGDLRSALAEERGHV